MSNLIGIDIGVGSIKIVSLSKGSSSLVLDAIAETKNPSRDWTKGDNKKISELVGTIKMLMTDAKIKPKRAVVSLPEDEIVSRVIRLPPLKKDEIREALRFEAETFIPYPLDQVSIDYEVMDEDEAGRLTVFAIAAKNELINLYVKLFKSLGLDLVAIESPAVAIKRTVNLNIGINSSVMVIDMGEKYSDIICLNKGNIYFTRATSVGGESMTRAISINLGLDMASAEEYKKAYGLKGVELEGKIKTSLLPVFSSMAEEIRRALVAFKEDQNEAIDFLALSGGGANLPGLAEELTRILGIEVQVIQPFMKIDTTKIITPFDYASEGCRFTLAIGLALRGMDV